MNADVVPAVDCVRRPRKGLRERDANLAPRRRKENFPHAQIQIQQRSFIRFIKDEQIDLLIGIN